MCSPIVKFTRIPMNRAMFQSWIIIYYFIISKKSTMFNTIRKNIQIETAYCFWVCVYVIIEVMKYKC